MVGEFFPPSCLFPTEHKRREAQKREKERLQNMDEEEYDALTEEEKITFNREVQKALRERKRRSVSGAGQKGGTAAGSNFCQAHGPSWRPGSSGLGMRQQWPRETWEADLLRAEAGILHNQGAGCCSLPRSPFSCPSFFLGDRWDLGIEAVV